MSVTSISQTAWSHFWSCTGPTAQQAETKQAEIRPISPEELRENQLSDRLTGPEATHQLIDYIRSLNTASRGGSTLLLSGGGGAFGVQIAEYLRNDLEVVHRARLHGQKSVADSYGEFPMEALFRELKKIPALDLKATKIPDQR